LRTLESRGSDELADVVRAGTLNIMSVAVLSLRVIIASMAVRSETMPVMSGGVNVGLPNDQTVESRTRSSLLEDLFDVGEPAEQRVRLSAALRTERTS
jgi:hypothetical protein